jgi:AcrR family transcriptional regulator
VASKVTSEGSGRAQRWEEHKEKTRRDLLASARALFAERGFYATSAADIAAGAGVTERTLFRYFPTKTALVLDEVIALLPELAKMIRGRPEEEGPYQAVCEGIVEFIDHHRDLLIVIVGSQGELDLPHDGRRRPLIDFEDNLAEVLRDRYQVPAEDQVTSAVWARASMGALRTAVHIAFHGGSAGKTLTPPAFAEMVRACFGALAAGLWFAPVS